MTTELVIFDCDGVLIDSEILVCRLVSEELTRAGYPITLEQVVARFAGRPEPEMIADIESDWGRAIPPEYFDRINARVQQAYATELQATPYVHEAVGSLRHPACVASSSKPEKLRRGLEAVGLYALFAPNVVSASSVARGKPAPDVFIYAAGWMRTSVAACVVVEDSIPGVRAARAAGMSVIGYAGGSHCPPGHAKALAQAGARSVFTDLRELVRSGLEAPAAGS
jgi:HAD superfamily hydrolase (TIGR01509 family)